MTIARTDALLSKGETDSTEVLVGASLENMDISAFQNGATPHRAFP